MAIELASVVERTTGDLPASHGERSGWCGYKGCGKKSLPGVVCDTCEVPLCMHHLVIGDDLVTCPAHKGGSNARDRL